MLKIAIVMLLLLSLPAAAQQENEAPVTESSAETTVEESGRDEAGDVDDAEDIDDADLDEQTYEEDDDDFIPTEEIPADEPIAFPSNI